MEPFPELDHYDALGLAELVRTGEVRAQELLEEVIGRIERLNRVLNAVTETCFEQARPRAESPPSGPFGGVPFLLKDLVAYEGMPVSFGSSLFGAYRPDQSHEVVRRMEASGLVVAGRTNTGELGLLPTTEPRRYGPTRNPWDLDRSPGGSSGGAAAAVAAGMVPMAHASDGGGSIRIPASACGLFGLKPSRGRMPQDPREEPGGLTVPLCVSRSVRDSAALLDAISGPLPGDRWWAPPPARPFLSEVGADPGRLRIAFTTSDFRGSPAHPECAAAVEHAARLCEELGHHVEEAAPALDGDAFAEAFLRMWSSIPAGVMEMVLEEARRRVPLLAPLSRVLGRRLTLRVVGRLQGVRGDPLERFTWDLIRHDRRSSPGELWPAWNLLRQAGRSLAGFLERHDVLLTPVLGSPPVRIGELSPELGLKRLWPRLVEYVAYTPIANSSGVPAMSVPLHWSPDGLPIGVQAMARFGDEATLLRLAAQLEESHPWRDRRPPPLPEPGRSSAPERWKTA